jgi:long-chain fatty acid transport protein
LLRRLLCLGSCWGALLAAGPAQASGFSVARFSGEHGHPTTDNPTALYFNPAALRVEQRQLFVDGLVGLRRVTYTRTAQPSDAPDAPGAAGANVGRATLANWLANPSLWLALPLGESFTLAAGIFVPFGGPISWDERESFADSPYPGPIDGVGRFHAIEGISITGYGSLGASYSLGKSGWRLGAAANLMYSRIDDVRAWSGGSNGVAGEGRSLLEVSGYAWGFGLGAFYESDSRRFRFGASYQSRPNVAGGMRLAGELTNDIGGPSSADVELHQDLPDALRASVAYNPRRDVELRLVGGWERWSAFERQCVTQAGKACDILPSGAQVEGGAVLQNVPREFHDAFEARLGASVWTSPALELFSGIGAMSQAVPDATLDASLPDFFAVTFSLGAKLQASKSLAFAASLSHLVSPTRNAPSSLASYEPPTKLPSASGHYTQSMSYADLNLTLGW